MPASAAPPPTPAPPPVRPRNDLAQYDDLAHEWWRPDGAFAALHWLAAARAELIPPPPRPGARLLDLGCGGGLLAPHVPRGYGHVGVDLSEESLALAARHGIEPVRADVRDLPFPDGWADVVVAGELFEHVPDLSACVREAARVLRPGGTLVFDTLADTRAARFLLVTVAERLPGGPPPRIHDPALFVDPARLSALLAASGVGPLTLRGLRPHPGDYARFLRDRRRPVRMVPTRSLALVYQGAGRKALP